MQLEDGPGHGAPSADGSDSSRERKMILPPSKASAKPPRSPRRRWTGIGASRPIPSSIASPPIFPLLLPCVAARSALATFRLFIYRAAHIRQNPKDDARPGGRGKGGSRQWQHPHLALAAFGWLHATPILSREAVGNHTVLPLYLYVLKLLMLCTSSNSRSRSQTPLDSIQTTLEGVVNIHQSSCTRFTPSSSSAISHPRTLLSSRQTTSC
jgi:hypothetical protein